MGAGIDDHVDAIAARLIEQASENRAVAVGRRFLAAQLGLGKLDQPRRSVAHHQAIAGEARGEIVDIGLADGRVGAEHADRARRAQRRGGLDRGDGADDRQVERGAHRGQRDGRGGVAGDDDQPRMVALRQPARAAPAPAPRSPPRSWCRKESRPNRRHRRTAPAAAALAWARARRDRPRRNRRTGWAACPSQSRCSAGAGFDNVRQLNPPLNPAVRLSRPNRGCWRPTQIGLCWQVLGG